MTLVGIGTAFALLLLLTLIVAVTGQITRLIARRGADRAAGEARDPDSDARDKALAAVVGVSVMRAHGAGPGAADQAPSP